MFSLIIAFLVGIGIWMVFGSDDASFSVPDIPNVEQIQTFVASANVSELEQKKQELETTIQDLSRNLSAAKDSGAARVSEVQSALSDAQKSYKEVLSALDRVKQALDFSDTE